MSAFRALLWKEKSNRFCWPFLLQLIIPVIILILINLKILAEDFKSPDGKFTFALFKRMKMHPDIFCEIITYPGEVLAYEPENPFLQKLMEEVACASGFSKTKVISGLDNEFHYGFKFIGIVKNQTEPPDLLEYIIYPNQGEYSYDLWNHFGGIQNMYTNGEKPVRFPLAKLQYNIDAVFMKMKEVKAIIILADTQDSFLPRGVVRLPWYTLVIFTVVIFYFENSNFFKSFMEERKAGITEYLKYMGVSKPKQRLASFLITTIVLLFTILLVMIIFYSSLAGMRLGHRPYQHYSLYRVSYVFNYIPPSAFAGFLILWAINISCFSYCTSSFFKEMCFGCLFHLITWLSPLFYVLIWPVFKLSRNIQLLLCLVPQLCFFQTFCLLTNFELHGVTPNLDEKLYPIDDILTLADFLIMHVIDIILYLTAGAYLEIIFPGKYGVPKPCSYFLSYRRKTKAEPRIQTEGTSPNLNLFDRPPNLRAQVSIQNLCKTYRTQNQGNFSALNNVSIDFYEGEITGVMGHKGAGKSTLLSILGGLTLPSSGKVTINDEDVTSNFNIVRTEIGYCGEEDFAIPTLNVITNVIFLGMVRGMKYTQAKEQALQILTSMRMEHVVSHLPSPLSLPMGGMKKLSLAMALIGNPKILILDKLLSEIHRDVRRELCGILWMLRRSKTIILSMKNAEEAMSLCDRIAIINHGELKFYGSPIFLQTLFGIEYSLSITVTDEDTTTSLKGLVEVFVRTAALKYERGLVLEFRLPQEESENFPGLLMEMDQRQRDGEILTYSVTVSNVGDALLNINNTLKEEFRSLEMARVPFSDYSVDQQNIKVKGFLLCWNQIEALLFKKWNYFRSNYLIFITFFAFFTIVHAILDYAFPVVILKNPYDTIESLPYTLKIYGENEILYSYKKRTEFIESFKKIISNSGSSHRKVQDIVQEIRDVYTSNFKKYHKHIAAVEFDEKFVNVSYNQDANFALPIVINVIHNALLRRKNISIRTSISLKYLRKEPTGKISKCPKTAFLMPFRILVEPWIFGMGILCELRNNLKTLQLMLSMPLFYWFTHIIFDLPILYVYSFISFTLSGINDEDFKDFIENNFKRLLLGLLFTSICTLLLIYSAIILGGSIIFAIFLVSLLILLTVIYFSFGNFGSFQHIKYLTPNGIWLDDFVDLCYGEPTSLLRFFEPFGFYMLTLFLLLFIMDSGVLRKIMHKFWTFVLLIQFQSMYPKDVTTANEEARINNLIKSKLPAKNWPILVLNNVRRWFCVGKRKGSCMGQCCFNCLTCCRYSTVKGASLIVNRGECFGLVGPGESGKSAICRIITGSLPPSYGNAYFQATSVLNCFQGHKTFYKMGYCPQNGGLFLSFQGREMLELFAKLRGFRGMRFVQEVDKWMRRISIEGYEKKKCKTYTFGMQRRLSTAVAFIGRPEMVILDEPTTKVDLLSRRCIWEMISSAKDRGQTILLTSKNVDECEAVCTRSAILFEGEFRCIGPITVLKGLYGQRYIVLLKISVFATPENKYTLERAMVDTFGQSCFFTSEELLTLEYQIMKDAYTWTRIFSELNSIKSRFPFLEYFTVSSISLEKIFTTKYEADYY